MHCVFEAWCNADQNSQIHKYPWGSENGGKWTIVEYLAPNSRISCRILGRRNAQYGRATYQPHIDRMRREYEYDIVGIPLSYANTLNVKFICFCPKLKTVERFRRGRIRVETYAQTCALGGASKSEIKMHARRFLSVSHHLFTFASHSPATVNTVDVK